MVALEGKGSNPVEVCQHEDTEQQDVQANQDVRSNGHNTGEIQLQDTAKTAAEIPAGYFTSPLFLGTYFVSQLVAICVTCQLT